MVTRARLALLLTLALVPAAAFGQRATTGTVTGRVLDSSGAVLPGVTVSLKSPDVLGDFTGITDARGVFRVANLPPGEYEARAELTGFLKFENCRVVFLQANLYLRHQYGRDITFGAPS